ncbi:MAG: 16S rRNA (guanine(966)-N(2))-methyltransferase RsmD [Spirochaetaceae bacterium]|nr:16S rRNA (guanine(966)-N(2))-methyltransferase RsmD [Myxococcales bacterium]MCB9722907.1 16S rRNA (guanine(966)-N(2))-methyltransferase RsmD [Spirochaetaceae bacterium]HPG25161.1 16S rRNA (guanine(966)-N(2))-methyltransferase RsmD [Myxococcota bacterium]
MRIIAGRLRGRDLGPVPDGVRPTSDRVRESLFSALGAMDGLRVLDLFAGTGALGLEAYSRGAEAVVLVERSRRVARTIAERLARLDLAADPTVRLVVADAKSAIRRLAREASPPFDLVLLDPPYAEEDARQATLEALVDAALLAPEARVVVERPKRHPLPPSTGLRLIDERRYGDTVLTWLGPAGRREA